MIPHDFVDFFVAITGVTGALIGLLFVAVSVAPRRLREGATAHVAQTQAAAALLMFTDTLVIGLLALFPGGTIGYATLVVALLGVVYCVSVGRVALSRAAEDRPVAMKLGRIAVGALIIAGFEVWGGLEILIRPGSTAGVYTIAATMIAAVVFGISRAWELVGLPGTSLFRSLAVLHDPTVADQSTGPEEREDV